MTRKIYDCFTFFNELELLEIRLREHYDHVDQFIIAEASKTHQGNNKPFYLENNWDRFSEFHDKITYVKVEDMPWSPNTWVLENFQRNALSRGLFNVNPNDVIVISDLDELLRASTFDFIRNDTTHKLWICRQPIFWSKINYVQIEPKGEGYNVNSMAIRADSFKTAQELRNMTMWAFLHVPMQHSDADIQTIQHAGWHFSYLGDDTQAKAKLESFAHNESLHLVKTLDTNRWIAEGKNPIAPEAAGTYTAAVIDDYFPTTIIQNQEQYAHLIVPNGTMKMRDILPAFDL